MKADEAPLYVDAYDLALEVIRRTERFPKSQRFVLGLRMQQAALDLLESITLALHDRQGRLARLEAAEAALTRLRLGSRLARDLELLGDKVAVALGGRYERVGRQLGGWWRRETSSGAQ